jgi:uncharacterized alkaline shock family protein YloU
MDRRRQESIIEITDHGAGLPPAPTHENGRRGPPVTENTDKSYSPEVISTYVWDAIKGLPGLADLHRSTLQSLGERVHFERMGPVRIDEHEGRRVLDLHVVITPEARLPELVPQIRTAVRSYLHSMTGIDVDAVEIHIDDIVWEPATGA